MTGSDAACCGVGARDPIKGKPIDPNQDDVAGGDGGMSGTSSGIMFVNSGAGVAAGAGSLVCRTSGADWADCILGPGRRVCTESSTAGSGSSSTLISTGSGTTAGSVLTASACLFIPISIFNAFSDGALAIVPSAVRSSLAFSGSANICDMLAGTGGDTEGLRDLRQAAGGVDDFVLLLLDMLIIRQSQLYMHCLQCSA